MSELNRASQRRQINSPARECWEVRLKRESPAGTAHDTFWKHGAIIDDKESRFLDYIRSSAADDRIPLGMTVQVSYPHNANATKAVLSSRSDLTHIRSHETIPPPSAEHHQRTRPSIPTQALPWKMKQTFSFGPCVPHQSWRAAPSRECVR